MFVIGKIVNTHGIKGEVKVLQTTDFIERFDVGETIYIKVKDIYEAVTIKTSRLHKNNLLISFDEYSSINDVEGFKDKELYIHADQQHELNEGEYYYHQIIGCQVETLEGEKLGQVDAILSPGANDVWVVKANDGKEYLIPYIPQVVKDIKLEEKLIVIEPMEGLLDL